MLLGSATSHTLFSHPIIVGLTCCSHDALSAGIVVINIEPGVKRKVLGILGTRVFTETVYSDQIKTFVADGANTNGQNIEKLEILSRVSVLTIKA